MICLLMVQRLIKQLSVAQKKKIISSYLYTIYFTDWFCVELSNIALRLVILCCWFIDKSTNTILVTFTNKKKRLLRTIFNNDVDT